MATLINIENVLKFTVRGMCTMHCRFSHKITQKCVVYKHDCYCCLWCCGRLWWQKDNSKIHAENSLMNFCIFIKFRIYCNAWWWYKNLLILMQFQSIVLLNAYFPLEKICLNNQFYVDIICTKINVTLIFLWAESSFKLWSIFQSVNDHGHHNTFPIEHMARLIVYFFLSTKQDLLSLEDKLCQRLMYSFVLFW